MTDKTLYNQQLTVPIGIEWTIDKDFIIFDEMFDEERESIYTKVYKIPGFPSHGYYMDFLTFPENEDFCLYINDKNRIEENTKWDGDLTLVINDGEPIKISEKFNQEQGFIILWKDTVENLSNNYFVNGEITFRLNGTITLREILYEEHYACITGSYKFAKDMEREIKDFIIEAEKQEIKVHKKILQKYSKVFSVMFENGWKEVIDGRIVIPDFPYEIVKSAISCCYGSSLTTEEDKDDLLLLFRFADKYDMDKLKDVIKEVIFLTPDNICEYANFVYERNFTELVDHCIDRLILYFQYSYPVKDLDSLNTEIKLQFFNRASMSPAMKRAIPFGYDKNRNDEHRTDALLS